MTDKKFNISILNEFKCIADKCKFTCCKGWDVCIDEDTYCKLKNQNIIEVIDKMQKQEDDGDVYYFVDKEVHEACPFLNKKGLCEIVNNHGDEYLSYTCSTFPRIENDFEEMEEITLSCACPEVVDIIERSKTEIEVSSDLEFEDEFIELKVRKKLIEIMKMKEHNFESRLMVGFDMLLSIVNLDNDEDKIKSEVLKYDSKYIKDVIQDHNSTSISIEEGIDGLNLLFLDMTENYKAVDGLSDSLSNISIFAENSDLETKVAMWESFKNDFSKYSDLNEKCIIAKILSGCVSNDMLEIAIAFEMIIFEYILGRYATFLKTCISEDKDVNAQDVKDYIVIFSRVIGNNIDAVCEYFVEEYEEELLTLGDVYFLTRF